MGDTSASRSHQLELYCRTIGQQSELTACVVVFVARCSVFSVWCIALSGAVLPFQSPLLRLGHDHQAGPAKALNKHLRLHTACCWLLQAAWGNNNNKTSSSRVCRVAWGTAQPLCLRMLHGWLR